LPGKLNPSKARLLLLLLASLALAQGPAVSPAVKRVGDQLACLCGKCNNTVATCQMLGCGYANPGKEKIDRMSAAGASDEAIIADFKEREGLKALATPPTEGFNLLSWTMPFVALFAGLGLIVWWIQHSKRPSAAPAELPPAALSKVRSQLDKEMARFEE
jgi:cytochrome c-type biogenesis protein CcmH